MNERELLYVKTIADTKSISQAAKELFIAQPSLSQALKKIEKNIGVKLFKRSHDGMELTYAGEKYYFTATEILNKYNDLKNEITYINDLKQGRITVGVTSFMGTHILPKLLKDYKSTYQNIEIIIREENSTVLEEFLINASIDFAIMHYHPLNDNKSIEYNILNRDPFLLVTKKNHPLRSKSFRKDGYKHPFIDINLFNDETFILMDQNKRIRQVSDNIFMEAKFKPQKTLVLKNFETARRLASVGYGVSLVPMEYVEIFEGHEDADYYYLDGIETAYWDTCVAINKSFYLSKAAKSFIELINKLNGTYLFKSNTNSL